MPSSATPTDVAEAMKRLRLVQYAIPVVSGLLIVLGAQQGEQQRPEEQRKGLSGLRRLKARD